MRGSGVRSLAVPAALAMLFLLTALVAGPTYAASTVTVYASQNPVSLDGVIQPGEWSDTPIITNSESGLTYAFKQNGTGLLFLMQWSEAVPCPDCFAGVELGHQNNTAVMGATTTPTLMILASPSFQGGVDEFISTGEFTPAPVEQSGYKTQTTCALNYTGGVYTAECYRPFELTNPSPYDFNFSVGSTAEIGFAVGVFTQPGNHLATDMSSYVFSISSQTTTVASSSSTISTSATSAAGSSSSSSSSSSSMTSLPSINLGPVSTYAEEFLVLAVGFFVLVLIAVAKYGRV